MIHAVKIAPEFFIKTTSGVKMFEVRKNDRDYRKNDYIALNEYKRECSLYTGRCALYEITYILDNPEFCKEGYVTMQLEPLSVNYAYKNCNATILNNSYRVDE